MTMLTPKPNVYMVFSIWHHYRYIGSTKDFSRRLKDHYRTALQCSPPFVGHISWESMPQRVHRCMGYLGPAYFSIIPLCTTTDDALRSVEKEFIRRLQPTLNVAGTTRVNSVMKFTGSGSSAFATLQMGNPGKLASRLRTAHSHVLQETLGTALPPSMRRLYMEMRRAIYAKFFSTTMTLFQQKH